jgi:hypothetical protein
MPPGIPAPLKVIDVTSPDVRVIVFVIVPPGAVYATDEISPDV